MKQYIVNLTNHLIGKNDYDRAFYRINNLEQFIEHVKIDLQAGDVQAMSPAKIGEIMCSFEVGDVMAGKSGLFKDIHFSGDCEEFLRELVSLCLAYAIQERLKDCGCPECDTPSWGGPIPAYEHPARRIIDERIARTI